MLKLASQIFGAYFVVALIAAAYFAQRVDTPPAEETPQAPVINTLARADTLDVVPSPDTTFDASPTADVRRTTDIPRNFPTRLFACKGMRPATLDGVSSDLEYTPYAPLVRVNGSVLIATAPFEDGCWSSPFGPRNGSLHKGVDYYNETRTDIYAAGDGVIKDRAYRDDYGNMLVIDHGDGVFTRYAHLESMASLDVGNRVKMGDVIGVMGNSAGYSIPRHLHYELLVGEWGRLSGSFALDPLDIMAQPPAK